jgi:hypothetical protein
MKKTAIAFGLITLIAFGISENTIRNVESAQAWPRANTFENYDVRLAESRTPNDLVYSDAIKGITERVRNVSLERHTVYSVPEIISVGNELQADYIAAADGESRETILRTFLKREQNLFGLSGNQIGRLTKTADYTNPAGNLSYVHLDQTVNGIPVFQGEIKAAFSRRNEIVRVVNNLAPNLDHSSMSTDFGDKETAIANAANHVPTRSASDDEPTAELLYFPLADGVAIPAWRVLIWTNDVAYYVVVEAHSGKLLWRKLLTEFQTQAATYNVYGNDTSFAKTADSPTPGTPGCYTPTCAEPPITSRQSFTLIGNEPPYTFNNLGWIPDGENRTIGNNAEAGIDRVAPNGIDPDGWAFGGPTRNFVYAYNPAPGNPAPGEAPVPVPQNYPPSAFQQGSITNAFYAVNRWHDATYLLGFNEASRNFQTDNFGRGGVGGDSISVEVQDSSGTNGANFTTPADGGRPRLQLFVWTGTTPNRDGALDSQIAIHEVTHGLTNRLHGNGTGLSTNMARGMGEGWSDYFALALFSETNDDQCGVYPIGAYSIQGVIPGSNSNHYYGLRRFPVARRACVGANGLPHNPLTFADLNAGCDLTNGAFPRGPFGVAQCDQIHNAGEIWSNVLWEVRGQLIDRHGPDEGNRRALQYITDGMKLSPLGPTMLQSRDAIVVAAQVSDAADVCYVWRGFAIRGFGFSASIQSVSPASVTEAFDIPVACRATLRADFDGDGRTDISVFRPNEGNWYLSRSTAGFTALNWGLPADRPAPGDYDGDGKTDVAVFRPTADGNQPDFYILNSSNATVSYRYWGSPGDVSVVEDYDGDDRADAAIFRPSSGQFWILNSSNGSVHTSRPFAGTMPLSGDFDGDGRSDYGVFSNGQWFVAQSSSNYSTGQLTDWGLATDKPVPADYDGDGRLDLAVYRPSNGVWYVVKSTGGIAYYQFGLANDVPVPADYDGDGRADVAVFRDGLWYIDRTTAGISIVQFGLSVDYAIPNAYLPQQ